MQRDAYGFLFKRACHSTIPINVLQANGVVQHERAFEDLFSGYKARRIVLTTHMRGSGPHVAEKTMELLRDELLYYESKAAMAEMRRGGGGGGRGRGVPLASGGKKGPNMGGLGVGVGGGLPTVVPTAPDRSFASGGSADTASAAASLRYRAQLCAIANGGAAAAAAAASAQSSPTIWELRVREVKESMARLVAAYTSPPAATTSASPQGKGRAAPTDGPQLSAGERWAALVRSTSAGVGAPEASAKATNAAADVAAVIEGASEQKADASQSKRATPPIPQKKNSKKKKERFVFKGELWGGRVIDLPANAPSPVSAAAASAAATNPSTSTDASTSDATTTGAPTTTTTTTTSAAGTTPPLLPLLDRELVVDSFAKLAKIHQPHYMYRLMPLMCTDMATFACLEAICAIPNAPFRIEWRRDPVSVRTGWVSPRSPVRDEVWTYYESNNRLSAAELAIPREIRRPPCGFQIDFDGLLLTRPEGSLRTNFGACALLQMRNGGISVAAAEEFGHQVELFSSSFFRSRIAAATPLLNDIFGCAQRYFVLASPQPIDRSSRERVLRIATERKFLVMEQRNGEFQLLR